MTVREFEISFRQLYVPLGMYALRIVGDTEDAEDLVENTFLNIWQFMQDGTDIDNFKAFMYRAVRNECLDFLRRKKETVDIWQS